MKYFYNLSSIVEKPALSLGIFSLFVLAFYISKLLVWYPQNNIDLIFMQTAIFLLLLRLSKNAISLKKEDQEKDIDFIFVGLSCFSIVLLVSGLLNSSDLYFNYRISNWIVLPLYWNLFKKLDNDKIILPLFLASIFYIVIIASSENPNILAFVCLCLINILFLRHSRIAVWSSLIAAIGMYYIFTCHGIILAFLSGYFFTLKIKPLYKLFFLIVASASVFIVIELKNTNPFHERDVLAKESVSKFLEAPLLGQGPGLTYISSYDPLKYGVHAHNLVLTTLAETGFVGLICILVVVFGIFKRTRFLPLSCQFLIYALAGWSLVDEPLQWWSVSLLFLVGLSRDNIHKLSKDI